MKQAALPSLDTVIYYDYHLQGDGKEGGIVIDCEGDTVVFKSGVDLRKHANDTLNKCGFIRTDDAVINMVSESRYAMTFLRDKDYFLSGTEVNVGSLAAAFSLAGLWVTAYSHRAKFLADHLLPGEMGLPILELEDLLTRRCVGDAPYLTKEQENVLREAHLALWHPTLNSPDNGRWLYSVFATKVYDGGKKEWPISYVVWADSLSEAKSSVFAVLRKLKTSRWNLEGSRLSTTGETWVSV